MPAQLRSPASMLLRSILSSTRFSALLAFYVLASECLQITLRSEHFLSKLGLAIVPVVAVYAALALACGAIVGVVVRAERWQAIAIAVIYYVVLSLKLFWLDSKLLANPMVALVLVSFSVTVFGAIAIAATRFALTRTTPLLFVVAYLNICALTAATWTSVGGSFLSFLLSSTTAAVAGIGGALLVGAVVLHTKLEPRRRSTHVHILTMIALITLAGIANGSDSDRKPFAPLSNAQSGPDIYVLSFDALRRDALDAFVASQPSSQLAGLAKQGTTLVNVVADGSSTYPILANNTYAKDRPGDCATSLPGVLRADGYATIMLLGRAGKRFDGAQCFDRFHSGEGDELAKQFKLLALGAELWGSGSSAMRARMIKSAELVDELERGLREVGARPLFAYTHFLDFHEPYVPRTLDHDDAFLSDLKEFEGRCFATTCDMRDPETARIVGVVRGAYDQLLFEADEIVGRMLGIARARGRAFMMIITADHGELFGEHGGFLHGGGFVPELLNIPYMVYDSRASFGQRRCGLLLGSEALRATVTGAEYPDRPKVSVTSDLGRAEIDRGARTLRYEVDARHHKQARTWRNVHPDPAGSIPYPLLECQ